MASVNHISCCLLLLMASSVSVSAQQLCRDHPDLIREHCDEYFKRGGITTILQDLHDVEEFDDVLKLKFLDAVANVSDDYIILTLTSAQVVMTAITDNNDMVEVSFFVLNPSGSVVVPTAFRSEELFLMMKLNDGRVETMFGQAVKPVDPNPPTTAIPIWAIAILGYAGVVILCAVALFATKDWRRRRQENLERSLHMTSMEKGTLYNDTNIPMTDMNKNKSEKVPVVAYAQAGVQTSPSARAKARAAKKAMAKMDDGGETSNEHTTIENVVDEVKTETDKVDHDETPNETAPGALTVEKTAGEENGKDTDPIVHGEKHLDEDATVPDTKGAVNEAFDADESEESDDGGTQSYEITEKDDGDESEEGDTQF